MIQNLTANNKDFIYTGLDIELFPELTNQLGQFDKLNIVINGISAFFDKNIKNAAYLIEANSLNFLNEPGYIICHDINPLEKVHQQVPPVVRFWNGDCWKAWVKLRQERSDLNMFVVDTDMGCGVISRGNQEVISINKDINFENLDENRKDWLNLISVKDFAHRLNLP